MTNTTSITLTTSSAGTIVDFGDSRGTMTLAASWRYVNVYSTGGYNHATRECDLPVISRHKTAASAAKAAGENPGFVHTYTLEG